MICYYFVKEGENAVEEFLTTRNFAKMHLANMLACS